MKPKHQRLVFIGVSMVFLCLATLLVLRAFRDNIVFYYSPTELQEQAPKHGLIRVGGLVETGSVEHDDYGGVIFRITDGSHSIIVNYHEQLPALFREGQGVVVEGEMLGGFFEARRVLTKHDEKYMPREVVDELKRSGKWRGAL